MSGERTAPRPLAGALAAVLAGLLLALLPLAAPAQQDGGPSQFWYEVEAINPALGPAPDGLRRETPQEAVDSFIDAARDENWDRAAHLLDLSAGVPGDGDAALAARHFAEVIERKLWIDWGDVPDRPDALVETGTSDNPLAGKPRKSVRLGILDAANRPVVVRLNRLKPADGDPVWLFASQTVERIPALYAEHGPGWFERAIPDAWTERVGDAELRRWELAALPLLLVAATVVFFAISCVLGWLAGKAPWQLARNAAAAARVPVAIVATAALVELLMTRVVAFSAPVSAILGPLMLALMIIGVAMALLRAIDAVLERVTERYVTDIDDAKSRDDRQLYTSIYALRRFVLLIAFVLGVGLLLSQLHLTETLGISLLASAGVLTVLLGIAGQAVLGNIFASLQIAVAKPIRIGDSVLYEGHWAYVESIYYTFVRLRTWDQRRLIVPVKYFVSNPFENWTMQDARMTRTFEVVLDHDADPEEIREAFMKMIEEDEDAMAEEGGKVLVLGHDHNGQKLTFYATAPEPSSAWTMHARLWEKVLAWVRENHPEWWPRERVIDAEGTVDKGGAAGDPGG